jgi:alpha-N-arabinofuranosidase
VFVRHAGSVGIACLAQSVNVIAPLLVRPTGVLRQTTFAPLALFGALARGGAAVRAVVRGAGARRFEGETLPTWIGEASHAPLHRLDVSAVLHSRGRLVVAVVNRAEGEDVRAEVRVAFARVAREAEVHEIWDADVRAVNDWADLADGGRERVRTRVTRETLEEGRHGGVVRVWKAHSVALVVLQVDV